MPNRVKLGDLSQALASLDAETPRDNATPRAPREINPLERRNRSEQALSQGRRKTTAQYLVEPEKCRMWGRHNRLYHLLSPDNCADLIDDIRAKGQQTPAIARPLIDDPDGYDYEVIAGARRHFAVSYLRTEEARRDILYRIEARKMEDEEAFRVSDAENRGRKDISDFEKAVDYQRALRDFYDGNVKAMSERIGMPRSSLRNYLNLASLPDALFNAFPNPTDVALRHANQLKPLIEGEATQVAVMRAVEDIAAMQRETRRLGGKPALQAPEVVRRLIEAGRARPRPRPSKSKKVEDGKGLLCEIENGRKFVTLRVPVGRSGDAQAISRELKKALGERTK